MEVSAIPSLCQLIPNRYNKPLCEPRKIRPALCGDNLLTCIYIRWLARGAPSLNTDQTHLSWENRKLKHWFDHRCVFPLFLCNGEVMSHVKKPTQCIKYNRILERELRVSHVTDRQTDTYTVALSTMNLSVAEHDGGKRPKLHDQQQLVNTACINMLNQSVYK